MKRIDLKLVSRLEFGSVTVAMRYRQRTPELRDFAPHGVGC
jgi:hypothetical protein